MLPELELFALFEFELFEFLFLLEFAFVPVDVDPVVVVAPALLEFLLPPPQPLKNTANDKIRSKLTALNITPPC